MRGGFGGRGYGGPHRRGGFYGGGRPPGGFYGGRPWRGGFHHHHGGYYRPGCLGCATYIVMALAVIALALIFLL